MAYRNSVPRKSRIILGCRAIAGENISNLAREFKTSRKFIYSQEAKVQEALEKEFDQTLVQSPIVEITEQLIRRIIFGCMVICKGSIEDTQEFLQSILHIHVSIGKISNIINELALTAKAFNDSISLESIKVGAHDEIFQAGQAVLAGAEPHSTYIYLCQGSETRDSTAWGCALLDKQAQGLNIEMSVNDGGTGLIKGIQEAYPNAKIQSDIFHAEKKVSDYMYRAERAAYKAIAEEYALQEKLSKAKELKKQKYLSDYTQAVLSSIEAMNYYDILHILYTWLKEAFQIGGYSYEERTYMLSFITSEIKVLSERNPKLKEVITYLTANQVGLLQFVQDIELKISLFAEEEKIDVADLLLMWEQLRYHVSSQQYTEIEMVLVNTLGDKYEHLRNKFREFSANKIVRASSIIECINSLLRPYLALKRVVYNNFLPLLQFYLNTRKYRRSRREHRTGKSPIELLTQKQYPSPLELLAL